MTTKIIFIVALISLVTLSACSRKVRAESRTISASSNASGSHIGPADVGGPVTVTCVSATDDSGSAIPPACVIDAPGTKGVVKIGDKVAVAGAGRVVLSCKGNGNLDCIARIEG